MYERHCEEVADLQLLVALYDYFDVFESEQDAIASFTGERSAGRAAAAVSGTRLVPATA
jgi:hypothetical protein